MSSQNLASEPKQLLGNAAPDKSNGTLNVSDADFLKKFTANHFNWMRSLDEADKTARVHGGKKADVTVQFKSIVDSDNDIDVFDLDDETPQRKVTLASNNDQGGNLNGANNVKHHDGSSIKEATGSQAIKTDPKPQATQIVKPVGLAASKWANAPDTTAKSSAQPAGRDASNRTGADNAHLRGRQTRRSFEWAHRGNAATTANSCNSSNNSNKPRGLQTGVNNKTATNNQAANNSKTAITANSSSVVSSAGNVKAAAGIASNNHASMSGFSTAQLNALCGFSPSQLATLREINPESLKMMAEGLVVDKADNAYFMVDFVGSPWGAGSKVAVPIGKNA